MLADLESEFQENIYELQIMEIEKKKPDELELTEDEAAANTSWEQHAQIHQNIYSPMTNWDALKKSLDLISQ